MSDDEFVEFMRSHLLRMINDAYERGKLMEYRYGLLSMDLLELNSDASVMSMIQEIEFGLYEMERSQLLERMNQGLTMIQTERNEEKRAKMMFHYDKLKRKMEEVSEKCMMTKY